MTRVALRPLYDISQTLVRNVKSTSTPTSQEFESA